MRVLKDEGSIWININSRKIEGDYFGIQYDIIKNMNNLEFKLIEVLFWHNSSGIPVNSKNLTDRFEYILGFVKSNLRKIKLNHIAFKDYLFSNTNYEEPINIWNMNRRSGSIGKDLPHPAIYPDELPQRLISILTQKGDTVLDPFLGSGTTTVAAINKGRSSVGFEINPEFKKLISLRINQAKNNLECSQQNVEYQERD
jgi:DNA modification methylase